MTIEVRRFDGFIRHQYNHSIPVVDLNHQSMDGLFGFGRDADIFLVSRVDEAIPLIRVL